MDTDVIDTLVGIKPGSALDAVRNRRPAAREQAQASYSALFAPEIAGEVTATERFAVATFVTALHGDAKTVAFYAARLAASGATADLCRAIDTAIAMAERRSDRDRDPMPMYFILGSAYGCRALYRSIHGGWFGAFKDGVHSCTNLEKVQDRDSLKLDVLSGIGAYHYWKSAKAKILTALPFVKDRRQQGIGEIHRAIEAHGLMAVSARRSLLAIYFNEKRYADLLAIADSLASDSLLDPNSRLHTARALIKLQRYAEAERALGDVLDAWRRSPYLDSCGQAEAWYLQAEVNLRRGDSLQARQLLNQIMGSEDRCSGNDYFKQSLSSARNLDL